MPSYEYACSTCGQTIEVVQAMDEDALTACTASICERTDGKRKGRGRLQRVLFAPAIHFKGSGFHNTDYGSRRRDSAGDGDGAKKDGAKKDAAKKDSGTSSATSDSGSSGKTVGLNDV